MKHTDIKELFVKTADFVNKEVTVCGWVRTWRDSKSVSFIELNDGTCLSNLQLVIEKVAFKESVLKSALVVGAALHVDFFRKKHLRTHCKEYKRSWRLSAGLSLTEKASHA